MSLPTTPDDGFYREILRGIGAPVTDNTITLLYAWRQTEGAKATYNPLNATVRKPGSTTYNDHKVQNYLTPKDGLDATIETLNKYTSITSLLKADAAPTTVAQKIIASRWGTKPLLLDVLGMYGRGRYVVAPIATVPGGPSASSVEPVAAPVTVQVAVPAAPEPQTDSLALRVVKWGLWLSVGGLVLTAALRHRAKMKAEQEEVMRWP